MTRFSGTRKDMNMFPPQLYLYEQVKQRQIEMEKTARQNLELSLSQQDVSNHQTGNRHTFSRLGSLLLYWGSELLCCTNEATAKVSLRFGKF